MKAADEMRNDDTASPTDDSELFIDLEAGASYWVELHMLFNQSTTYGTEIRAHLNYSGTLYDPGVHLNIRAHGAYWGSLFQDISGFSRKFLTSQATMETSVAIYSPTSANTNLRGSFIVEGRITCVDAGRLSLQWRHYDNGSSSSVSSTVKEGSFLYVTPLDICPI
jgi:hypothetical protein